jgi:GMP synthase-like glutamine amidotransferase
MFPGLSGSGRILTFYVQDKFDLLVVPGGAKGADTISKNPVVQELVQDFYRAGKLLGFICNGEQTDAFKFDLELLHRNVQEASLP